MQDRYIYKVCEESAWRSGEILRGSADDRRDGFIHFSTAAQLPGTLEKHFRGRRGLVLLRVEAARLGDRLRWEPSRGGALFPHLYGELAQGELELVDHLREGADGGFSLPELG